MGRRTKGDIEGRQGGATYGGSGGEEGGGGQNATTAATLYLHCFMLFKPVCRGIVERAMPEYQRCLL